MWNSIVENRGELWNVVSRVLWNVVEVFWNAEEREMQIYQRLKELEGESFREKNTCQIF